MGTTGSSHQNFKTYVRNAHHAGSWYEDSPDVLDEKLQHYLDEANMGESVHRGRPRGIIAPHAGYSYSGPTAAYAYLALKEAAPSIQTVVVLHPSHHVYLNGCAVSGASELETPLGNLKIDDDLRKELLNTGKVSIMQKRVDEREHSGEMHYPYIQKVLKDHRNTNSHSVKVLPIMVGSIENDKEESFGKLLKPYLSRPNIFTVVSSDFCHWGCRFDYTPQGTQEIHEFIESLDKRGMDLIEMKQPGAFANYLKETSNTICGRHPIAVWLHAIQGTSLDIGFVKYDQSSKVKSKHESSVSYASAVARTKVG